MANKVKKFLKKIKLDPELLGLYEAQCALMQSSVDIREIKIFGWLRLGNYEHEHDYHNFTGNYRPASGF